VPVLWLKSSSKDGWMPGVVSRSVAQLVEHRSPKPGVMGSSPFAPAIFVVVI
jgi:hypothetical protein